MSAPSMKTFAKVVVIALLVMVGVGVLIHNVNAGEHRPSGYAERWLTAISDTGRPGLRGDAMDRAEDLGSVDLAQSLVPAEPEDRHGYFSDLEVGRAAVANDVARVPYQLHQNVEPASAARKGTLVLRRDGDRWRVTALDARRPGERVPSEGGPRPSRASLTLWIGAIVLGVILAFCSHSIVRYADRTARRALAAGRT